MSDRAPDLYDNIVGPLRHIVGDAPVDGRELLDALEVLVDQESERATDWLAEHEAVVRATERERIAQAIEAIVHEPDACLTESQMIQIARDARIARNQEAAAHD